MARIRTIKPQFFTSEDVSVLPLRARLTWVGLWTHVDDAGRAKDNVKLIKAAVWPLDEVSFADVEEDLATLAEHGRIVRYAAAGGRFLAVTNWSDHQKINKPTPSKIPPPPSPGGGSPSGGSDPSGPVDNSDDGYPQGDELSTNKTVIRLQRGTGSAPVSLPASSGRTPAGKGKEGKGREGIDARAREAARWLHSRYGLTEDEASTVIEKVQSRAASPIAHLIPYMDGMADGDLADIVAAVADFAPPLPLDEPADPWCGECDRWTRQTGDPDRPQRCPLCHPLRNRESA